MTFALLLSLALICSAQSVTIISVKASSAQAAVTYTVPDSRDCTIAVSSSASLTPLFSQVDTSAFGSTANSDSQWSMLASGLTRTFVLGRKQIIRGTDGLDHDLNLGANSTWFYEITCPAANTAVLSFTTGSAPMGLMYVDPVQADPTNNGEVANPVINWAARQSYVDPQTSLTLQPVTLPHDITGAGSSVSPYSLTNAYVSKTGSGWSGSNFPYTITLDQLSGLVFGANGMQYWPAYPFDEHAASYASDVGGNLNWAQWVVVASSSNASCPGTGTRCQLDMCMSEDKVHCDPYSPFGTCLLNHTNTTCTFGTTSVSNQGGWASPQFRFRNGPETADRNAIFGNIVCNGTSNVVLPSGQPTNPLWSNGTPITINGSSYLISSIVNETTLALQSTCPAGNYTYNISTLSWILKVDVASADTITVVSATSQWEFGIDPAWPDAGWWPQASLSLTNSASSYLLGANPGLGIYAINANTGATALIGTNLVANTQCQGGNGVAFDTRNNEPINYCVVGNQLYSRTYSGSYADQGNFDGNNQNLCGSSPCWNQTQITSGSNLDALALAFDPAYLGSSKGISCNFLNGINQNNHLLIRCWANNQALGYIMMFDPLATSNSQAGNAGCMTNVSGGAPGCVIAFIATFLAAPSRGTVMKGDFRQNAGPGVVMWQPDNNAGACNGCTNPQVIMAGTLSASPSSCPTNPYGVAGNNCSTITVSGEPYDPTPGPNETGLPGEYITATAGDYLTVSSSSAVNANVEVIRILIKNSSTSWTVQRGVSRGYQFCGAPYVCGSGIAPVASVSNPVLYYGISSGEMMWQYLTDPTGTNVSEYNYDSVAHRATQNGYDIDCCSINGSTGSNWPPCLLSSYANGGCMGSRIAANTPALLNALSSGNIFTGSTPLFPQFQNTLAIVGANPVQIHPSLGGLNGSADSTRYFNDARPLDGIWFSGTQPCSATNVTGSLWKVAAGCYATSTTGGLHRKQYPTKALTGWRPLLDVSGPSCSVASSFPATYRYGVVVSAGECHAGSLPGEIYFSVPWLTFPYCLYNGLASAQGDAVDICILDNNPMLDTALELPLDSPFDGARRQRIITHMFAPGRINAPFGNLNSTPNNLWWLVHTRQFGSVRSEILLVSRTPEVVDSVDRTQYATPSITLPPAPGYAMLQFGNLESGANGKSTWFCTSRADACNSSTNLATAPFWFSSETLTPTPCSIGCTIQMSLIPDRFYFYRWVRTNAVGAVISAGPTQWMITP